MYGHIFDVNDWWLQAQAASQLARLQVEAQGRLTNMLVKISTLDDPYYMSGLSPAVYQRLLVLQDEA